MDEAANVRATHSDRTERLIAVFNRDPMTAPHRLAYDCGLAALACLVSTVVALLGSEGRPDVLGWVLLLLGAAALAGRRWHPVLALLAVLGTTLPYHALDNPHNAPLLQSCVALYTVAATSRPLRSLITAVTVLLVVLTVIGLGDPHQATKMLPITGWVLAMLFLGFDVRVYRNYVESIVQRAERAERTRAEEVRRGIAEERLRIARDLHDLLAHSITLIGVQTSVAAHVVQADPERLDRAAVAATLEEIAETCRSARGELRSTLSVLRAAGSEEEEDRGPVPGIDSLPDLAQSARAVGANVQLEVKAGKVPSAVGAAAYRIVQEALTNTVRHGGPEPSVRVRLFTTGEALLVDVIDHGVGGEVPPDSRGFGLTGMRERARSVGGVLLAGPRKEGGFAVSAEIPLPAEAR